MCFVPHVLTNHHCPNQHSIRMHVQWLVAIAITEEHSSWEAKWRYPSRLIHDYAAGNCPVTETNYSSQGTGSHWATLLIQFWSLAKYEGNSSHSYARQSALEKGTMISIPLLPCSVCLFRRRLGLQLITVLSIRMGIWPQNMPQILHLESSHQPAWEMVVK